MKKLASLLLAVLYIVRHWVPHFLQMLLQRWEMTLRRWAFAQMTGSQTATALRQTP